MWAVAIFDLGLSTPQFYDLTLRQFSLLAEARRKQYAHREMVQAYTTAAVINFSLGAPLEPVQPVQWMPSYRIQAQAGSLSRRYNEEDVIEWQAKVAQLAAEMKQGGGAMLDEIRSVGDG